MTMTVKKESAISSTQGGEQNAITQDVLKNSLAFRGASLDLFVSAVHEVDNLTSDGSFVYPPSEYPSLKDPTNSSSLQRSPSSTYHGRLAPTEAVGIRVLQAESLALMQSFARTFKLSDQLDQIMGTGENVWQSDAMEAIGEFSHLIALASGTRELLLNHQGEPTGKTWGDRIVRSWYQIFSDCLTNDNNKIGEHTASRIVKHLVDEAERTIPTNPGGAKGEIEIKARINGKRKGAELAKALYLETINLAKNQLSDTLDPENVSVKVIDETSKLLGN